MIQTIRTWFRITILLTVVSFVLAVVWQRPDLKVPPAVYIFLLGFLASCWCNYLLIRGGYIGKSSLVLWVVVSVLGAPPIGFIGMLFVLNGSIKSIETTGTT